ncbi:neprilysin-1 [Ixodes scapularis]|uniref:neprilysin-1 n=1 Tax=Ixodes scapularis TaxID=6945 RepID=UPI001C38DAAD|nr:neprilysin-1 [Ixodes scapularis]
MCLPSKRYFLDGNLYSREDNGKGGSYWWFVIGAIPVSTFLLVTIPIAVFLRSFVGFDRVRLCETRACREAGKFYESMIDKGRVDPCEDFYSHVCEKWNRNARIPPFSRKYSFDDWIVSDIEKTIYTEVEASITEQGQIMNQMTHIPVRKFEAIFAACQNAERNGSTEDIKKVPLILGLEHFPSLDPEGDPKISVISGRLAKDFGLFPLVSVGLRVDPEDYSKVIIYLEEPETTALPKFILSTTESSNWLRQSVCDAMLTVYGIVPTNDQWDTLCDNIQAFDIDLIKRLRYAEGHRPGDYFEKKVLKLKELDNSFYWNWMTYLKTIFEGTSITIGPHTKVLVGNVKYVAGLARFLQKQSKDVIYNYLGYRVLLRLGLLYRTHENHVKTLYYRYHLGYKTEPERWRLCLRYAERSMPMAASWIYHMWIKKKFGLKGDKLWIKFFNVYRKLYESIDYSYAYSYLTTADARVEAYRKLKDVRVQLFFINATMTDPLLNLYGGQETKININTPVPGIYEMTKHYWNKYFMIPKNGHELDIAYTGSIFDIYSTYHYDLNSLYISHGSFHGPMYARDKNLVLDLVKSGYRIGRNLLKAIDERGGYIDSNHMRTDWMGYYTRQRLSTNKDCVYKQYSGKRVAETRLTLNANATVNEDMIDVAVITPLLRFYRKMIYEKAYPFPDYRLSGLHHVSSDQLFFYSLAESFCEKTSREAAEELIQNGTFSPMKYRINNSLRNSAYFAKAFFCPVTSRMNAGKRSCDFWSTFKKDF